MAAEDNDVASRQLGWLRKVREAVNLTGPPPPEVLRSLAPPSEDDISQDEDGKTCSTDRLKEPISPASPKVVEEIASLRWELQERQRTVSSLEELVDLLQTRCRELEDESRELVDLVASKHEQEQLEAGVPHERRDEDDYLASIKERQMSREPIPPLGRTSMRSNISADRDAEIERLRNRCDDLEEERLHLEKLLEAQSASVKQKSFEGTLARTESESEAEDPEQEDLAARCQRLEAEKEKLQKHVERLWQMCEALDAGKPEEQCFQGRQGSLEEINFEAVVEHAVSAKENNRLQLAQAEAEKSELQVLVGTLHAQIRSLEARVASEEQETTIGAVARCEELTRQKAEVEKELGELANAYAELQGNLHTEKKLKMEAEAKAVEARAIQETPAPEEAALEEQTFLRSQAEAALAEQKRLLLEAQRSHEELQTSHSEALAKVTERCDAVEQQNLKLQEEMDVLVETHKTVEATAAIKFEGLQERYDLLQAERNLQASQKQIPAAKEEDSEAERRCASLEEEVAVLRKQVEELIREKDMKEELLGTDAIEDLKADIAKLTEENGHLEAECQRREAQKEELVLQMEEALRGEAESKEELKDLRQKLLGVEEAKELIDEKAATLRQQLQCSQAEGDMLSSELQKVGQQLQDAEAKAVTLQEEYDRLRISHDALEADHTDLTLRAEEALAGHEKVMAEHQRVVDQAKHLERRQGTEEEGLKYSHQLLSAEVMQVKAERDMLQKQVKQQEQYTESRQADLKADAERLRDETLARADEWKVMVAELSELRASRSALEAKCSSLLDKAGDAEEECQKQKGIAESARTELQTSQRELQHLQKTVADAASKQQTVAEEAERLRTEASGLEAARRALQREVEEYRRQGETWQMEQGILEADASRLFAANEALVTENAKLRSRVQALAPKSSGEEAYLANISAAEQWVLYHAGMPLESGSMPYLSGVTISFGEFFTPLAPLVLASSPTDLRSATTAIQSGELARTSLQCFRLCDSQRHGYLTWENEEVSDLVDAVFQRRGLRAPSQELQRLMFARFDQEYTGNLSAQDCLCLVDALFRALLMSPAALSARVAEAPEGPIVVGKGGRPLKTQSEARQLQESIAQSRLQMRLEEAERAAERAVEVAGSLPEPITASFSAQSNAPVIGSGRVPVAGTIAPYRTEMPNVKLLDPARIRQSQ